jgi:hypothetical protein
MLTILLIDKMLVKKRLYAFKRLLEALIFTSDIHLKSVAANVQNWKCPKDIFIAPAASTIKNSNPK